MQSIDESLFAARTDAGFLRGPAAAAAVPTAAAAARSAAAAPAAAAPAAAADPLRCMSTCERRWLLLEQQGIPQQQQKISACKRGCNFKPNIRELAAAVVAIAGFAAAAAVSSAAGAAAGVAAVKAGRGAAAAATAAAAAAATALGVFAFCLGPTASPAAQD